MLRRDFLAGLALPFLKRCALPRITVPLEAQATEYLRLGFRVVLSEPRLVYSTASGFAHFAGLNYFPVSKKVVCRINTAQDTVGVDGELHKISSDYGHTWPTSYVVQGSHTSNEPLTYLGGQYVGGQFNFTFPGGDNTKTTCPRSVLTDLVNGYTQDTGTVTFNGYPQAIDTYGGYPAVSWFGTILQIASNNWVTTTHPVYVGGTKAYCEAFRCTDGIGLTWNYLSSLPVGPSEGVDEASMTLLGDGRIMLVSRIGQGPIVRSFSSDNAATWGALASLTAWMKAPYIRRLTNDALIIVTGFITRPREPDQYGNPPPGGYAPASMGLYMQTDPDATSWPVVDIGRHHNSWVADGYKLDIDSQFPNRSSSGYMCSVEMSANRVLIVYDRSASGVGEGNQVFVVEGLIERV